MRVAQDAYEALQKKRTEDLTVEDKAFLILGAVERELAEGLRHFNRAGQQLNTVEGVLACLQQEGSVFLEAPDDHEGIEAVLTVMAGERTTREQAREIWRRVPAAQKAELLAEAHTPRRRG